MGLYTKVGSTTQEITQLSVNVDGVAKNVHTVYTQIDGVRIRIFPSTEIWTLVYESTTPGAYSYNAGWGSYQIVMSGGGGGGAASGWQSGHGTRYTNPGNNAEQKGVSVNVYQNTTLTISGIIGAGGTGGKARFGHTNINTGGTGGTGYQNGSNGRNQVVTSGFSTISVSGGGGGGSTSTGWDNIVKDTAKGGNGGDSRYVNASAWGPGGTGGGGGTTTGTGASGGSAMHETDDHQATGGTGANGYVRIYKSNILPEIE